MDSNGKDYYSGYEVLDFIESQGLGFSLGNVVKYVSRAGKKNQITEIEDLKKALDYLQKHIYRRSEELIKERGAYSFFTNIGWAYSPSQPLYRNDGCYIPKD